MSTRHDFFVDIEGDRILSLCLHCRLFLLLRFLILQESDKAGLIQTLAQIGVVSILDGVISAAFHLLGDVAPSVAVH